MSSQATKIGYLNELKRFKEFYKIRDYDSLTTIEPKKLNIMIEDYIMSRTGKAERSSLNRSLSAPDLFFSMNDITLNFKKIKKLVPKQENKLFLRFKFNSSFHSILLKVSILLVIV